MRRCRCLFLACLVIAASACAPTAADSVGAEANALIARYGPAMTPASVIDLMDQGGGRPLYTLHVALTIDDDAVRLAGTETVRVTNASAEDWDRLVFRLYPNLESYGGDLAITAAAVDGETVTPALDETRSVLDVPLSTPLPPGQETAVDLTFETTIIPGHEALYNQLSYLRGVVAAANFFPLLSVYQPGEGWWRETAHPQGDAVFSETAFFEVWLTAPADLIVATSGVILAEAAGDDGTVTYAIVAPLMRDFAVMGSAAYRSALRETVDGVRVNVLAYEEAGEARAGLALAVEALRVFNAAFGPYPFAELDVVETLTAAGGIEYPGLIVIADARWDPADAYFEAVIVHEVAHQWWYSLVGNDQTRHPWLDESLTQYAVVVYLRQASGEGAAQARLGWYADRWQPYRDTADDRPIGLPVSAYGDAYFDIVYGKGPLFFQALAEQIGNDSLLGALQGYLAAHRYGIVYPADMLRSFEQALGRDDLDGLFRQGVGEFAGLP